MARLGFLFSTTVGLLDHTNDHIWFHPTTPECLGRDNNMGRAGIEPAPFAVQAIILTTRKWLLEQPNAKIFFRKSIIPYKRLSHTASNW